MGQHVDGERVEQQVERGPFERGAARARSGVRHFDERVALPLRLRFEPHPPQQVVARELHPVVGQLALGTACLSRRGSLGLEQLELAAVAGVAQRRAAARTACADGRFPRQRAEPRVVELTGGRMEAACESADTEQPPAPAAARSFHSCDALQLGVVRRSRDLEAGARRAGPAVGVRQLFGNHVHDAAQGIGPVQHARGSSDQLHPLRQPGVYGRTVLVAPGVVFEAATVLEHQHARPGEPADDGLADLLSGGEGIDSWKLGERVGERHALRAV